MALNLWTGVKRIDDQGDWCIETKNVSLLTRLVSFVVVAVVAAVAAAAAVVVVGGDWRAAAVAAGSRLSSCCGTETDWSLGS